MLPSVECKMDTLDPTAYCNSTSWAKVKINTASPDSEEESDKKFAIRETVNNLFSTTSISTTLQPISTTVTSTTLQPNKICCSKLLFSWPSCTVLLSLLFHSSAQVCIFQHLLSKDCMLTSGQQPSMLLNAQRPALRSDM